MKAICPQCNKEFKTFPYRFRMYKRVFCSKKCMGESYKYTPEQEEQARQKRIQYMRLHRFNKEQQGIEYREKKKEHLRKLAHANYIKNKDKIVARANLQFKKRMEDYHSDEAVNIYENVKASLFSRNKRLKNEEFRKLAIENSKKQRENLQAITIEAGAIKSRRWTEGEIQYLKDNYKSKTVLELALYLNRTFNGTKSAIERHNIGKKNRDLTSYYHISPLVDKSV